MNVHRIITLHIIFLCTIPMLSFGQYKYNFLQETFFGRLPNARAEAMGRGYSSISGDLSTIFFNPAGTATLQGIGINGSYSYPYYLQEEAKYRCLSAGYRFHKYLTATFGRNHFTSGMEVKLTDIDGSLIGQYKPMNSDYFLNLSSEPIPDLYIGLNAHYFIWKPIDETANTFYFDLGIIKKFGIKQGNGYNHSAHVGASVVNLSKSSLEADFKVKTITKELPVISRFGANYELVADNMVLSDTLNTFSLLAQAEYQLILNSSYHSGFRTGMEFTFLEIISLRMGYYKENVDDFDIPTINKDNISSFTYGFGLGLPLNKLAKVPLIIQIDYTTLPQASYTVSDTGLDDFSSWSLSINWLIGKNKL